MITSHTTSPGTVHLTNGKRTICGLTHRQASDQYRYDAPTCEECGPRDRPNEYLPMKG